MPPNGLELRVAPRACEGQLPGGSGNGRLILGHSGGQATADFPHASRVSCSELLASARIGLVA